VRRGLVLLCLSAVLLGACGRLGPPVRHHAAPPPPAQPAAAPAATPAPGTPAPPPQDPNAEKKP
jgi:hypothetical protein